jgi:excisionase family DNA binding protein
MTKMQPERTPWLTTADAEDYCQCSAKTLGRAVAAGRLQVVRLAGSGRFRFRAAWLDAWLLGDALSDTPDSDARVRQAASAGNTPESDRFAGSRGTNVKVS